MTGGTIDSSASGSSQQQAGGKTGCASRYIHSDIWDRLISSSDDLTGIVAYGLYQKEKREWISHYEQEYGRLPSEDEVKGYSNGYRSSKIRALLAEAEGALTRFNAEITETQIKEMQSKAFNHRVASEIVIAKKLLEDVRNVITERTEDVRNVITERTGYKHHIITHITGFIAIAVIFTALAWAFAHDFSPTEISRNIVDVITGHKSNGAANIPSTPPTQNAPTPQEQP